MAEIRILCASEVRAQKSALAGVLLDCVAGGAAVSFMAGLSQHGAENFFDNVAASIEKNERFLLAAFLDETLVGTVQVVTAMPENQPHRADVTKLLVASHARGRGIGSALVRKAEEASRLAGKTLLVLDTVTGGNAERLYQQLAWTRVGVIPNYSLLPHGGICGTTIFWKKLC